MPRESGRRNEKVEPKNDTLWRGDREVPGMERVTIVCLSRSGREAVEDPVGRRTAKLEAKNTTKKPGKAKIMIPRTEDPAAGVVR